MLILVRSSALLYDRAQPNTSARRPSETPFLPFFVPLASFLSFFLSFLLSFLLPFIPRSLTMESPIPISQQAAHFGRWLTSPWGLVLGICWRG
jgi:hypothetical protein